MQKQNPAAQGRVLRNSLAGASVEPNTPSSFRTQHLIGVYGVAPEKDKVLASLAIRGDCHRLRLTRLCGTCAVAPPRVGGRKIVI